MRNLTITLMAICLLSACEQMPEEPNPQSGKKATVTLQLCTEQMTTRAIDENAIKDVNIFIYKTGYTDSSPIQQFYTTGTTQKIEIEPGSYYIAVAANVHKNMGNLPLDEVRRFQISAPKDGTLCMLGGTAAIVTPSTTTIPITIKRQVAKIAYNVTVAPEAGNIEITSIQLCHVPQQEDLGVETDVPTGNITFMDSEIRQLSDGSTDTHGLFYMLSNRQGQVSSIQHQDQRSRENAPRDASFIQIRGRNGHNKVLDYVVYLGQNTTDDFDIYPNQAHTYDITIKSDSELDTRIHSYIIDISDWWTDNTYCCTTDMATMEIGITNSSRFTLSGLLEVTSGSGADFGFGYFNWDTGPRHEIQLPVNGSERYDLGYAPALIRKVSNSTLSYRVTISDSEGESTDFNFTHEFANRVQAIFTSGSGTVTATGALESKETATQTTAYCYEDGCTLTANSKPGYTFEGWYADSAHTQLLSTAAAYKYIPTAADTKIYAKFAPSIAYKVQINCVETNKNSTYMYNRNAVSITSENFSGALNIKVSAPSGGVFVPGTTLQYTKTISSGHTISIDPLVFVPTAVGTCSYTIDVETGNGFALASRTVTNTAVATKLTPTIEIGYSNEVFGANYYYNGTQTNWSGYGNVSLRVAFSPMLDYPAPLGDSPLLQITLVPRILEFEIVEREDEGNPGYWIAEDKWISNSWPVNAVNAHYADQIDRSSYYIAASTASHPAQSLPTLFCPHTKDQTDLQIPQPSYLAIQAGMLDRTFVTFTMSENAVASEIQLASKLSGIALKIETNPLFISYTNKLF